MTRNLDCFALMLEDESQVDAMSSVISSEEGVTVSSRWPQQVAVSGAAWPWTDSATYSCVLVGGIRRRVPKGKPASMKWTLISMITPKTIRKTGSEAIAAATGAPDECEEW